MKKYDEQTIGVIIESGGHHAVATYENLKEQYDQLKSDADKLAERAEYWGKYQHDLVHKIGDETCTGCQILEALKEYRDKYNGGSVNKTEGGDK